MKLFHIIITSACLFSLSANWFFAKALSSHQDDLPPVSLAYNLLKLCYSMCKIKSFEDANSNSNVTSIIAPVDYFTNCRGVEALVGTGTDENDESEFITIVFGGSEELIDWLVNFNQFALTYYGQREQKVKEAGFVHLGQNNALFNDHMYSRIDALVSSLLSANTTAIQQIYVTGHSQGGAYASFLGPALAKTYSSTVNVTVVTYGQPRMAKSPFKCYARKLQNLALWRFVLKGDQIPRTPATWRGYAHAGHLIHLEEDDVVAYFQQTGNKTMGYAGVSAGWNGESDPLTETHVVGAYVNYFESRNLTGSDSPSSSYPATFESL